MSINISVITSANRTRRFTLDNIDDVNHLLDSLKRSTNIFSGKPLIIGSAAQTNSFSSPFTGGLEGEHCKARIDFYFPGDHVLNALVEGDVG